MIGHAKRRPSLRALLTTNRRYAISYAAQSAGQSLTVQITVATAYTSPYGPGNATLGAVALA
jgi:hypothetical protein